MNKQRRSKLQQWWFGTMIVLMLALAMPMLAQEITGSLDVIAGTLNVNAVDDPAFASITLDGTDQTRTDTIDIGVTDFTGTGAGWKLQVTSTTFTNAGSETLPNTATAITSVAVVCNGTCTNPTSPTSTLAVVPAGAAAPAAETFFNAAVGTGIGDFTITPTIELSIPATTYAGTYQSTVTITIVSAP